VRGKKVLPSALESFKRLVDSEGKFRIPTVFVTNAGNAMRHDKAKQLSSWLEIEVYEYCIIPSLPHFSIMHLELVLLFVIFCLKISKVQK
jgi:ribonucleotide monophosphatase NagD (HAD superfamily)